MRLSQRPSPPHVVFHVGAKPSRPDPNSQRLVPLLLACLVNRADDRVRVPAARQQDVTVMFCDIADYSRFAERAGPDLSHRLVTSILERVTACVEAEAGSVVDFYGDGVLVMWNAPSAQADHASRACRTALAIQAETPGLSVAWADVLGGPLTLRCTLNTGPAIVGNTGTLRRVKYGPMGHTINLAQRVQSASKFFGLPIVLTAATCSRLEGGSLRVRRLGRTRLASMAQPTDLFELHDADWGWRAAYEHALTLFEAGQWREACMALQPALHWQGNQLDLASLHLLGRAIELLKRPTVNFAPEWDMAGK